MFGVKKKKINFYTCIEMHAKICMSSHLCQRKKNFCDGVLDMSHNKFMPAACKKKKIFFLTHRVDDISNEEISSMVITDFLHVTYVCV
jgi:hypothetical protein